jgi:hypothetical protein
MAAPVPGHMTVLSALMRPFLALTCGWWNLEAMVRRLNYLSPET